MYIAFLLLRRVFAFFHYELVDGVDVLLLVDLAPGFYRHAPDFDEADGGGLVEDVPGGVGRERLAVDGGVGLHAVDDAVAFVELHADCAVDGFLRRFDKGLYRFHERREPVAFVGELAEFGLELSLRLEDVLREGQRLELFVRGDERERAGALVDFAALEADEAVFNHVYSAEAGFARGLVHDTQRRTFAINIRVRHHHWRQYR